jgi:hypothetical protein
MAKRKRNKQAEEKQAPKVNLSHPLVGNRNKTEQEKHDRVRLALESRGLTRPADINEKVEEAVNPDGDNESN